MVAVADPDRRRSSVAPSIEAHHAANPFYHSANCNTTGRRSGARGGQSSRSNPTATTPVPSRMAGGFMTTPNNDTMPKWYEISGAVAIHAIRLTTSISVR